MNALSSAFRYSSTDPRNMIPMISFCPHLLVLSFFLFVSSVAASNSVTASPTNDTNALTQQFGALRFFLSAATNSSVNEVNLAPLTSSLATLDYSSFQVCCNCHHTQCVSRVHSVHCVQAPSADIRYSASPSRAPSTKPPHPTPPQSPPKTSH